MLRLYYVACNDTACTFFLSYEYMIYINIPSIGLDKMNSLLGLHGIFFN